MDDVLPGLPGAASGPPAGDLELGRSLVELVGKRFGAGDGLLASVFLADALREGGVAREELGLLVGTLAVSAERASEALRTRAGAPSADGRYRLHHNALRFRGVLLDPVLSQLVTGATGVYDAEAPPALYEALTRRPIYTERG